MELLLLLHLGIAKDNFFTFARMAGEMEENNSTAQNTMEGLAAERLKAYKGGGAGDNEKEYESGMTSNASGGLELMGVQSRGEAPAERQSSINTEPLTLDGEAMHDAKEAAVNVLETFDSGEALRIFLKDAEDDEVRQQCLRDIEEKAVDTSLAT